MSCLGFWMGPFVSALCPTQSYNSQPEVERAPFKPYCCHKMLISEHDDPHA